MIKKFNEYLKESETGAPTTASPGSGTAVGGTGSGDAGMTYTTAMGVSVSGGDSGSAFSTNSNVNGMGPIVSPQPSTVPGDVRGGKKGSGDIGSVGGTFTKQAAGKKKKKKTKKDSKRSKTAQSIDKLYTTKYSQTDKGDGKIIQKWDVFKESLADKMTPVSKEEIQKTIEDIGFEIYGLDLEEKGNFNQDLTDIYISNSEDNFYKIGQIRKLGDLVIFYPDFRSIESGRLIKVDSDNIDGFRELNSDEKSNIILELNKSKKFGNLMDDIVSYLDIIKDTIK